MSSLPISQLTLDFEPSLPEKYPTLRDYLAHRVQVQGKPAKTIAGDMDMSPSILSRKLSPSEGDTQRFNVDDLERYFEATDDAAAVIAYLASKYLESDESKHIRMLARAEQLMPELQRVLSTLKGLR